MITTIAGPNTYLVQKTLKSLTAEFIKKHGDLVLERLDGEETAYEKLTESIQSMPFLASKKLVVILNPSANKQFAENFEKIILNIPDGTDVMLVEPKPDKRTVFYKMQKKQTEFREFNTLNEHELPRWLVSESKARGGDISMSDALYLIQRVGTDQQLLSSELDKLMTYSPKITRSNIDLLTEPTPQTTVFQLLDAAFAGDNKKVLDIYSQQRMQKIEPHQIMAMVAWQLHVLAIVKTAGERSADEIAKEAALNPFVVRKSLNIARNIKYSRLKEIIHDAYLLDIKIKSKNIDSDDALQQFLLAIDQ